MLLLSSNSHAKCVCCSVTLSKVVLDTSVEAPASRQGFARRIPIMYGSDSGLSDLHTVSMHCLAFRAACCLGALDGLKFGGFADLF